MSPCIEAIIKNPVCLKPNQTVKEAMNIFKEEDIRSLPVLDDEGRYLGLFGLRHVLVKLLPTSVAMKDGLENIDFIQDATPGISKRLKKLYDVPVSEVMDPEGITLEPDTATWEALRVMALHGSPVALVDKETQKFEGLISRQTLLADLERHAQQMGSDA